jgi:hypothetical protein
MNKFVIVFLFLIPLQVRAQEYGDSLSHHQVGISASTLSGLGGSYSYIFNRDFRIKSTIFAYYEDQGSGGYDWTGSLGLELQFSFESGPMTRFYGIVGGYYYHYFNNFQSYYYVRDSLGTYTYLPDNEAENDFAFGIGAGFEVLLWKHLVLNLDAIFQFTQTKVTYSSLNSYPSLKRYLGPGGGAGISYRF